jgi:hypothetical protein
VLQCSVQLWWWDRTPLAAPAVRARGIPVSVISTLFAYPGMRPGFLSSLCRESIEILFVESPRRPFLAAWNMTSAFRNGRG